MIAAVTLLKLECMYKRSFTEIRNLFQGVNPGCSGEGTDPMTTRKITQRVTGYVVILRKSFFFRTSHVH